MHDLYYIYDSHSDFIYPLFIHEDSSTAEIASMPGCFRHSLPSMMKEVHEAIRQAYLRVCLSFA